jgi:PAS domain S-box-containing protein
LGGHRAAQTALRWENLWPSTGREPKVARFAFRAIVTFMSDVIDASHGPRGQEADDPAQTVRRLTLLNQIANSFILASASEQNLATVFSAVAAEIGAEFYFNYEIDDKTPGRLSLRLFGGVSRDKEHVFRVAEIEKSVSGLVVTTREVVLIEGIQSRNDEDTKNLRMLGAEAYIGYPLIAHGTLFGTIAFAAIDKVRFTQADFELVKTLADQCAAVLDRSRLIESLAESEARYRAALSAGRIGAWETNFLTRTRIWSDEGMALFGISLPDGVGHVGGASDEYLSAMHPDDRHLVQHYHELANEQDSFPAEYRVTRPDGTLLWLSGHGRVISRGVDGKAHRMISIMVDITERKKSEDHVQFLMREMSHRSKNLLSVIQAIAGQTARTAGSIEEFENRFILRMRGLAASHDILVDQNWHGAPLRDLVRLHLAAFVDDEGSRLEVSGPRVIVTAPAAQAIGLALNELATNAAKYGSLSIPNGKVLVHWDFESAVRSGPLKLTWLERGGPTVSRPNNKGFGHVVIERMVASALDGMVEIDFAPEGLVWILSIPASNIAS